MKKGKKNHLKKTTYHTILREKWREALSSVLPIVLLVLALCFVVVPVPLSTMLGFLLGAALLIIGTGLFTLGTELAMTPIGEEVGAAMTRSKKLWVILLISFLVGFMITMSEPDLQVLASQVPGIPNMTLILMVAAGVGLFLVVALLRILLRIRMAYLLLGCYAAVFLLALFVPKNFLAVAFDSGGVTTGPMTVPFILALGFGVSSIRSDKNAENDSFGLVALSSVGPILAVMILSLIFQPEDTAYSVTTAAEAADTQAMSLLFLKALPHYLGEVALALAPIAVFFLLFQLFALRLPLREVVRILCGLNPVFNRRKRRLYADGVLSGTGPGLAALPLGAGAHRYADGLLCSIRRACRARAEQAGVRGQRGSHSPQGADAEPVHRCVRLRGSGHGAGADRAEHSVSAGARLLAVLDSHVLCTADLYLHRL